MVTNPEEEALAALKAHQEEAGMIFENPDAPVEPGDADVGSVPGWMTRDEKLLWP
jgi:hypothetical protein